MRTTVEISKDRLPYEMLERLAYEIFGEGNYPRESAETYSLDIPSAKGIVLAKEKGRVVKGWRQGYSLSKEEARLEASLTRGAAVWLKNDDDGVRLIAAVAIPEEERGYSLANKFLEIARECASNWEQCYQMLAHDSFGAMVAIDINAGQRKRLAFEQEHNVNGKLSLVF